MNPSHAARNRPAPSCARHVRGLARRPDRGPPRSARPGSSQLANLRGILSAVEPGSGPDHLDERPGIGQPRVVVAARPRAPAPSASRSAARSAGRAPRGRRRRSPGRRYHAARSPSIRLVQARQRPRAGRSPRAAGRSLDRPRDRPLRRQPDLLVGCGTMPLVGLIPARRRTPPGIRIEPAPSPPWCQLPSPPRPRRRRPRRSTRPACSRAATGLGRAVARARRLALPAHLGGRGLADDHATRTRGSRAANGVVRSRHPLRVDGDPQSSSHARPLDVRSLIVAGMPASRPGPCPRRTRVRLPGPPPAPAPG